MKLGMSYSLRQQCISEEIVQIRSLCHVAAIQIERAESNSCEGPLYL